MCILIDTLVRTINEINKLLLGKEEMYSCIK